MGDIRGAVLSSGELPAQYRPLYARLPPGGIPGVPSDALIEVIGHIYGLNSAPSAWRRTLTSALLDVGFVQSKYDPCLFYMRKGEQLMGIYGVHVDDCATGGVREKYQRALEALRKRFEFRRVLWRPVHPRSGDREHIHDARGEFYEKLHPLRMSRSWLAEREQLLTADEIPCLRAINGGLNWLASQSHPDLST